MCAVTVISSPRIDSVIRSRKMRWEEHVARMEEKALAEKLKKMLMEF
jgi:hypothetical protein